MTRYRYLRGSQDSREAVEYDITRRGQYITTCVVDVDLLICGIKAFPCGNEDDDIVQHFVDSVPPVLMLSSCTQGGEAYSHEADERGAYRPTYITFRDIGGGYWQFDGYCFYRENTNRCTNKSRLEQRVEEARREVEAHG